ncbi:MAG: hypothetical protein ACTSXX_00480 [Candidatus Baldrarchaeia archaeon]
MKVVLGFMAVVVASFVIAEVLGIFSTLLVQFAVMTLIASGEWGSSSAEPLTCMENRSSKGQHTTHSSYRERGPPAILSSFVMINPSSAFKLITVV